MYTYKRTIRSGNMIEVEIYRSIRKRDKKSIARGVKIHKSTEKQKILNEIRAKKHCRRLIAANFTTGDMYITMSFRDDVNEEEANAELNRFLRRLGYYRKKNGMSELKYIGCVECGKRGNRWHVHIVINKIGFELVSRMWKAGRVWSESLYRDGMYCDLAKYITKDTAGKKRMKQSRNLIQPERDAEVIEIKNRKQLRELEMGVVPEVSGYRVAEFERTENDITGTAMSYTYLPIV